jgi:hypothetical protein
MLRGGGWSMYAVVSNEWWGQNSNQVWLELQSRNSLLINVTATD